MQQYRHTFLRLVRASAVALVVGLSPSAAAGQKPVVIDGATNPEQFPQWYVWESVFEFMPTSHNERARRLQVALRLSDEEINVLLREATLFKKTKELLRDQLSKTKVDLEAKGKKEDQILEESEPHIMNYRYRILEARGRVEEALSMDAWIALKAWTDQRLRSTRVYLSGHSLKNFWKPW